MDLHRTDRMYKTIDASVGHNKFLRILSKIDTHNNVTVEFYYYYKEDIGNNGKTIENKRKSRVTEPASIDDFDEMVNILPELHHEFKIIGTTDHSNTALDEAMEATKHLGYGKIIG